MGRCYLKRKYSASRDSDYHFFIPNDYFEELKTLFHSIGFCIVCISGRLVAFTVTEPVNNAKHGLSVILVKGIKLTNAINKSAVFPLTGFKNIGSVNCKCEFSLHQHSPETNISCIIRVTN